MKRTADAADLRHVVALRDQIRASVLKRPSVQDLGYENLFEVKDLESEAVVDEIERVVTAAAVSILQGKGLTYSLPSRTGNTKYVPELDTNFLEHKEMKRFFGDVAQTKSERAFES
jgi:meiotic recombination protein SPO11